MRAPVIVIPVFDAPEAFQACLDSLRQHTPQNAPVIVVDDASLRSETTTLMKDLKSDPRFTVLRNRRNKGYTASVNSGVRAAGRADVVLLNSDTRVTAGWLEGLTALAFADRRLATVTAMSDNGGAFSFPEQGRINGINGVSSDAYAAGIIRATKGCRAPSVPTGSGFCMWIRRAALDQTGLFDTKAFARGYGEENDFCMRAASHGWRHVVSPWSYVFHKNAASFKDEKADLVKQGLEIVVQRYPDYFRQVSRAFDSAEMKALRSAARLAQDDITGKLVSSTRTKLPN